MNDRDSRYDRATVAFHWVTALLVAALWIIGQTDEFFPRGPERKAYWSVHFALGLVLIVVLVLRLAWRATRGRKLPDMDTGLLRTAAKGAHHLLYLLLVVVLGLGIANAFAHGSQVFDWFAFPKTFDETWRRPIGGLHELGANALLALALGHAAAALWHQFVRKDGLLARMRP